MPHMFDPDPALAEELRSYLLRAFGGDPSVRSGQPPLPDERELQLATAVLCLSVMRADHECRQDEHRALMRAIERILGLGADDAARVVRTAEDLLESQAPFEQFVKMIDRAYTRERKCRVVEGLWRVAFADAELAAHEEYLVRKIADLLHLTTADLVETKVRAREAFGREDAN
jgi:uncharacterized tellurite resistance protein B-like protein